jgi:hypothetical protein
MAGARQTVALTYDGTEYAIGFSRASAAASVEKTICITCGVPWGSSLRLADDAGKVYPINPAILPDGKRLSLSVGAEPAALVFPAPVAIELVPTRIADQTTIMPEPEADETFAPGPIGPIKVVVCGDTGVGKTTFINRLKAKNPRKFKLSKDDPVPTTGADVQAVELDSNRGTKAEPETIVLKFWEVGGGDDFAGLRSTYYSGADAALIFFRFGMVESYWSAIKWRNQIVATCGDSLPVIICGLGADENSAKPLEERAPPKAGVSSAPQSVSAQKWAAADLKMVDTPCLKVSCKSGSNVYTPVNYILSLTAHDPEIKCKKDGGKAVITPEMLEWHGLCEHISTTFEGMRGA